ncbi:MAG TPA: radical SAM family heme chaperone HemW [Gemmatimonadaceae bacterium]|nr:radical SAM family heme chaperone HemW [Gemmatimonadaceae bacterium]
MGSRHVYVHVPFCARRCSYCDFAIAVRRVVPVEEFLGALDLELSMRFERATAPLETIYLGGGTPSRLGPEGISRTLELLLRRVTFAPDAEVTIEANPEDVTLAAASAWKHAGVNRVSLGAQSFDAASLGWMHRTHSSGAIAAAVGALREAGLENVSLDLIFALPDALSRDWSRDLEATIALEPDHISLYGLTVEPRTPLGRWSARGAVAEAPEERYESEFLLAHERLTAAGYEHYEVSNFARPGRRSRHNSAYWARAPYEGFGPSAHAFDGERRRWNLSAYTAWVAALGRGRDPVEGEEVLNSENRAAERVYLGLRTSEGLVLTDPEKERTAPWRDAGWATQEGGRLRLTPVGWLRLDALAVDLTVVGSRY